jgi:hypothetical protein
MGSYRDKVIDRTDVIVIVSNQAHGIPKNRNFRMLKTIVLWTAVLLTIGIVVLAAAYFRDMRYAYERVLATGTVIRSPYNGELAKSNGELVAKAAELVRLVGGEVATIAEVREILQLGSASS